MLLYLGIVIVLILSYWNGANDVSKTISTIVGGRVSNYKKAVLVGASFNAIGTLLALFFAQAIFRVFTKGLLTIPQVSDTFAMSVILGAALWIFFATKTGMPVSTTHSIIGAIIFLAFFTSAGILWKSVILKVALPLLLSPLVSFILAYSILLLYSKRKISIKEKSKFQNFVAIDSAHWISCAASSFARGMNDGPKFVALAATFLLSTHIDPRSTLITPIIFTLVAIAMGLGGLIHGLKVTNTLSHKVTKIGHVDGLLIRAYLFLWQKISIELHLELRTWRTCQIPEEW